MSAGWNAKRTQRETARRLWDAKMPKKRIAKLCQVSEYTVSHWRWEDKWPSRSRYEDRPIREPKRPPESMEPTIYRCSVCNGRSDTPIHPSHEVAA